MITIKVSEDNQRNIRTGSETINEGGEMCHYSILKCMGYYHRGSKAIEHTDAQKQQHTRKHTHAHTHTLHTNTVGRILTADRIQIGL